MTNSKKTPYLTNNLFFRLMKISNAMRSSTSSEEEARNIFVILVMWFLRYIVPSGEAVGDDIIYLLFGGIISHSTETPNIINNN
jgi:hypothetical protein